MTAAIYDIEFPEDSPGNIAWINRPNGVLHGPHRHPLSLYQHTGAGTGVPIEPKTPTLVIAADAGEPPDVFPGAHQRWYISQRAKTLLEHLDGGAFDFRRAQTLLEHSDGSQTAGPQYYVSDVIRFVDVLDETNSRIKILGPMRVVSFFGSENKFFSSRIGSSRILRPMYSPNRILCTADAKDAIVASGISGLDFEQAGSLR